MKIGYFAKHLRNVLLTKKEPSKIETYLASGQLPWTDGYGEYKINYIHDILQSEAIMQHFELRYDLPAGFGFHLDERVIEYPWLLSRLSGEFSWLLDAGGSLNYPHILDLAIFKGKSIVIYTLEPGNIQVNQGNISYIYADLRNTILKSQQFERIVCISTLEHIGMDNTFLYTTDQTYRESNPRDYLLAIREFKRLLVPGGRLYVTIPYGKYQNHGWLQQFDEHMLNEMLNTFSGELVDLTFYQYSASGWQIADKESCKNCEYFDIHTATTYDQDFAAAARAVVCVELQNLS